MARRIAKWSIVGQLIVVWWLVYAFELVPVPRIPCDPAAVWNIVRATCPVAFLDSFFHLDMPIYSVMVVNALTYAMFGLIFESMRRRTA
ncbi:MAG: hypothetical protein ACLGRW_06440 [Acidobacteriota bacterium]